MKKFCTMLILAALCAALCLSAQAADTTGAALPEIGAEIEGFRVVSRSRFDNLGADTVFFEHIKTGAKLLYIANEDINRFYSVAFRTPPENDNGVPHVFEHATLSGSEKYPYKKLFFNLHYQTYNTYMNASTYDLVTMYPLASLSEKQLLLYADWYNDSVFNPLLMTDKSIFDREAWRYAMTDADAPLTLAGTVYTEMKGSYTIKSCASHNFYRAAFPGAAIGNKAGGVPKSIPQMQWEDLKAFHDKYYHPSNSVAMLYGKFDDYAAFLKLADSYYAAYEKKEYDFSEPDYTPITESVVKTVEYPVEEGSDTKNGAVAYYGVVCGEAQYDDYFVLDMLTKVMVEQASPFMLKMKERLPSASVDATVDLSGPEYLVHFTAKGLNAGEEIIFRDTVNEAFAEIAETGFDAALLDSIGANARRKALLAAEETDVGKAIRSDVLYMWFFTGDIDYYAKLTDNAKHISEYQETGAYQAAAKKFLVDNPRSVLVIAVPAPGLKEKENQALADELAGVKAGMTADEIAAIVQATAEAGETKTEDSSAAVSALTAVTVESLPEEIRLYDIIDETGEDGVRRMEARTSSTGIGEARGLIDVKGLPMEELHWLRLYTDIVGEMDTEHYASAELKTQVTRYLYNPVIRVSIFNQPDETVKTVLRFSFIVLNEDMQTAYDLMEEILFHSKFDDAQKVLDWVQKLKTALKADITGSPASYLMSRAYAAFDPSYEAFEYISHLPYYAFLETAEKLLTDEPDKALQKLRDIQAFINNREGAVSTFAGGEASAALHRPIADAFFAKLDRVPREAIAYDYPAHGKSEALIIDSAVQYNLASASYAALGAEGYDGAYEALSGIVNDSFLQPLLRDQYGAYGAYQTTGDYGLLLYTYRDPNIRESFDVFAKIGELLNGKALDQATIDGYILSAYTSFAQPEGELTGAVEAMINALEGIQQEDTLKSMRQLKATNAETIKSFAPYYATIAKDGYHATAGGAAAINQNAELYDVILNPFGVKDAAQITLDDAAEGAWYYEAVRYAFESGFMKAKSDTAFGVTDPVTLGELAGAMHQMLGGSGAAEESIAFFAGHGVLPAGGKAEDKCTREQLALYLYSFCAALGIDVDAGLLPLPALKDVSEVQAGFETPLQFVLTNQMMTLTEDHLIAPNAPATRADLAYALMALSK